MAGLDELLGRDDRQGGDDGAGHERDEVTALVFPAMAACRALCGAGGSDPTPRTVLNAGVVRAAFSERLTTFAAEHSGHSTSVVRMILLEQPPSIDGQELTDKGSVNQKQVLANRADLVEQLYGARTGAQKRQAAIDMVGAAINLCDAVENRTIVDSAQFTAALGTLVDGVVACLNASIWHGV